ncbi:flagellar biosynthesis anti-sigma factor FlgM [Halomonas daqiaonensis]|uniref:Negative regulator of flagellin synthesis n=1 Tax=Halomonas daqiaonensis TaxID=650850 RepID=A0A1H7SSC4_9GAMM|nr:flagellar biosynthesis anti-sigma factor FlgM [Halomonas daqiaonensis]SEL74814.1 anti-sigma-28 factor, FlgM family [Halomonas daqiaonensis]
MIIDNHHPLPRPGQAEPRDDTRKIQGSDRPQQQDAGPSATTHLSQGATDASQDIDTVRVEELRDAIRDGKLDIRADRIADGLIASVQDLLGSKDANG